VREQAAPPVAPEPAASAPKVNNVAPPIAAPVPAPVAPAPARLTVRISPASATVQLDGRPIEAAQDGTGEIVLDRAGLHTVRVSAPHHRPWTRSVETTAGKTTELEVALEPTPRSGPPKVRPGQGDYTLNPFE
jgi:hypothetical protein